MTTKLSVLQFTAALLCILSLSTTTRAWNEQQYRAICQSIARPSIKNRAYNITDYGASAKASPEKNQKAINKAIAKCSSNGGGQVIIPAGTWNTGAIRMMSNVCLVVGEGATLKFAFKPKLYPLVRTAWEGLECWNYSPCIYGYGVSDVAITGKGTIDGGGNNSTWWQWSGSKKYGYTEGVTKESQKLGARARLQKMAEDGVPADERKFGMGQGLRPQLINFVKSQRILISGVRLINSPFWVIHPLLSRDITIDGVSVYNEGPNGDGCDPEACENVLIENCTFHTGDDCIAIKSGRNNDGRLWNRASRNIIIRRCKMEDGHGGVVIGSEISGGCENVFAEDCLMDSPHLERVLRIKTNNCRGGLIQNINMRRVKVGQCREAVLKINLNYESREDCYRGFEPTVRQVCMEHVTCGKSEYGVLISGLDSIDNIYDIRVRQCVWDGVSKQPVKITGRTRGIIFDSLYINGKYTYNRNIPYGCYSRWMAHSEMKRTPRPYLLDYSKRPKWSYSIGVELEGMLDTYLRYKDDSILTYLKEYPDRMIDGDGNISGYSMKDYNLDNVRPAKFLWRLDSVYHRPQHAKALKTVYSQLEKQPRTGDGIFWHKAIYTNQVWLDGIFMGLPFYDMAAPTMATKGNVEKAYDDIAGQIMRTGSHTFDPATGLWKHAWDATLSQFWADKNTGCSRHTWARALGWYAMAITEVLDYMPEDNNHHTELTTLLNKVMQAVVKYQDHESGVWYDVMDVSDSLNYLEATASCMFAYVLLKATRMGWIDSSLRQYGIKAYNGILTHFVSEDEDGGISLTNCCSVSGLGPGPGPYVKPGKENYRRDGSFRYYMSEPRRSNDAKGIGPFLWASLEME